MTVTFTDGAKVEVIFDLEVEDGFPPISAEKLHGILLPDGLVQVDNTPFFVEGIALGDIVACEGNPPLLSFDHLERYSGNKALSVIFIDQACEEILYQALRRQGLYCEYGEFPQYDMLAVSIPADADYLPIKALLEEAEQAGKISFAELCIK